MTSPGVFFERLMRCDWSLMPGKAVGTIRFVVAEEQASEYWRVGIDHGEVRVFRDDAAADCVVRAAPKLFDEVLSGRVNALSAMLRGTLAVEGDPELLSLVQRLVSGLGEPRCPTTASPIPAPRARRRAA